MKVKNEFILLKGPRGTYFSVRDFVFCLVVRPIKARAPRRALLAPTIHTPGLFLEFEPLPGTKFQGVRFTIRLK